MKNSEDCCVPTSCPFLHSTWPSFHMIVMNGFVMVGNFKQCCLVRASAITFSGLPTFISISRQERASEKTLWWYHLSHFLSAGSVTQPEEHIVRGRLLLLVITTILSAVLPSVSQVKTDSSYDNQSDHPRTKPMVSKTNSNKIIIKNTSKYPFQTPTFLPMSSIFSDLQMNIA